VGNLTEARAFEANDSVAESSLFSFDLSWNKTLWNLQIPVEAIDDALRDGLLDAVSKFHTYTLSTIRCPGLSGE
jgi:hypothetical protein